MAAGTSSMREASVAAPDELPQAKLGPCACDEGGGGAAVAALTICARGVERDGSVEMLACLRRGESLA